MLKNDSKSSETIFCIKEDFILKPDSPWEGSNFLSGLNQIEKLSSRIIFERIIGTKDRFFHIYANSLPSSLPSPLFWSQNSWNLLEKFSLFKDLKENLNLSSSYTKIRTAFQKIHSINELVLKTEIIDWGLRIVLSRYLSFVEPEIGEVKVLAPFLDLANHWPRADTADFRSFEKSNDTFCIKSPFKRKAGQELFVDYGAYESQNFFLRYLIGHKKNPNDLILFKLKTKDLESLSFQLQSSRVNFELIQRLTQEDGSFVKIDKNFQEFFKKNRGSKKASAIMKAVFFYRKNFEKFRSSKKVPGLREARRYIPYNLEEKSIMDFLISSRESLYLHQQAIDQELIHLFHSSLLTTT
jgi:hypothetical protein